MALRKRSICTIAAVAVSVLLVAVIGSAIAAPAPPAPPQEWGAADRGVQARIRPTKTMWGLDEVPTFALDLRNHGDKAVPGAQAAPFCEIEFDGVWYVNGENVPISMPARNLPAGGQIDGWFTVTLDRPWVRKDCGPPFAQNPIKLDKVRLHTAPGKHIVRVAFQLQGVRPVSAATEITVLLTDAVKGSK